MNKSILSKKTAEAIIKDRILRISSILIIVLLTLSIVLVSVGISYSKKIKANEKQIADAETQLNELQSFLTSDEASIMERTEGRSFASYDEVIPFIGLLESLFGFIDPESKINVKNDEKEILTNRYADYDVLLNPTGKTELFLKGLDELHNSKYLTKIVNFNMNYAPKEAGKKNELQDVSLTIRLYFE